MLIAQRVSRHDPHGIFVVLRLHVLFQQGLQCFVTQAGGRNSVVYTSPIINCITIYIHRHQVLAVTFFEENAQLEQAQLRYAVVYSSPPSVTRTLQRQRINVFIRTIAYRLAELSDV